MIIHDGKRKVVWWLTIGVGLLFAAIFIWLFPVYWLGGVPSWFKFIVHAVCGLFMVISFGMFFFSEDLRYCGIFSGVLSGTIIGYSFFFGHAEIEGPVVGGSALGILVIAIVLLKNRFDWLAWIARGSLVFLGATICAYLFWSSSIIRNSSIGIVIDVSEITTAPGAQFYAAGFCLILLLVGLLGYLIVGIKGPGVFILGPRDSGKTFLLLALQEILPRKYKAHNPDSVIVSPNKDDQENLRLENLHALVKAGRDPPARTANHQISLYRIKAKKFKVCPVTWTVLDYAGEYYKEARAATFEASLKPLAEAFNKDMEVLKKTSGTPELLEEIQREHLDDLEDSNLRRHFILNTIYSHLTQSGKVVLLIDGEKLLTQDGIQELTSNFSYYAAALKDLEGGTWHKSFGGKKRFAFVVTKLDILLQQHPHLRDLRVSAGGKTVYNLAEIPENSPVVKLIEERLYEILNQDSSFVGLTNMLDDIFVSLYAISGDATVVPEKNTPVINGVIAQPPRGLAPWGVRRVIDFGLGQARMEFWNYATVWNIRDGWKTRSG